MRNPFATKGRKLHRLIAPKRIFRSYVFEPGKILEVLDRITIPEGMEDTTRGHSCSVEAT